MPLDNTDTGHSTRRSFIRSTAAVGGAGLLAGCTGGIGGGGGGGGGTTGTPEVAWASANSGVSGIQPKIMLDQDFDEDNDFIFVPQWTDVGGLTALIVQNHVDSGQLIGSTAARQNIANPSDPLRMYRPMYRIHESVMVHEDVDAESIDDLAEQNLTIGSLGRGSSLWNIFAVAVHIEGYDVSEDFDVRTLGAGTLLSEATQGNLDAFLIWEPHVTRFSVDGPYREMLNYHDMWTSATGHSLPIGGACAYQSNIDTKGEGIYRLSQAWNDVGAYLAENSDSVFEQYAESNWGLTNPDVIEAAKPRISGLFYDSFNEDAREGHRIFVEEAANVGLLDEQPDLDELFIRPEDLTSEADQ